MFTCEECGLHLPYHFWYCSYYHAPEEEGDDTMRPCIRCGMLLFTQELLCPKCDGIIYTIEEGGGQRMFRLEVGDKVRVIGEEEVGMCSIGKIGMIMSIIPNRKRCYKVAVNYGDLEYWCYHESELQLVGESDLPDRKFDIFCANCPESRVKKDYILCHGYRLKVEVMNYCYKRRGK